MDPHPRSYAPDLRAHGRDREKASAHVFHHTLTSEKPSLLQDGTLSPSTPLSSGMQATLPPGQWTPRMYQA